jgi:hypothetical protein
VHVKNRLPKCGQPVTRCGKLPRQRDPIWQRSKNGSGRIEKCDAAAGRGEGSIYQRTDGTWCATYSAGYAASGRRVRKTIFGLSKEQVAKKLSKVQATRMDGTFIEPSRMRLSTLLERWLEDAARPSIRQTTYYSYKGIIKNHIDPDRRHDLGHPQPVHIQRLYADMNGWS